MKRIFTLLFAVVMMTMTAMAEDYTDNLQVTVDNNDPVNQETTITVTKNSIGKYTFSLKNFSFSSAKVGDIELTDIDGEEKDGIITLVVSETTIKVKNPGFPIGTTINIGGGIKFSMTAKISKSANKMYADMSMEAIGQNIKAIFGEEKNITGISNLPMTNGSEKEEMFNLQGQRISEAKPGQVVIVKKGGKAVKVVK